MKLTRAIRGAAASIAVVAVSAVSLGVPAALAGTELCPAYQVCLFDSSDYNGLLGYRGGGQGLQNISSSNNDRLSSWVNKSGWNGAWYEDANGSGQCHTMYANSSNPYVGFWDNDTASSWKTNGGC